MIPFAFMKTKVFSADNPDVLEQALNKFFKENPAHGFLSFNTLPNFFQVGNVAESKYCGILCYSEGGFEEAPDEIEDEDEEGSEEYEAEEEEYEGEEQAKGGGTDG